MTQLRPPGLDALGLPAALRWHAGAFESRTGIRVKVTADETLPRPSPAVEDVLLRIYIEALNNVANHAAARRVAVSLEARGDAVVTSIADQGRGIDATQRLRRDDLSGGGLMIMEERARSVGAELRIHSAPGEGTRVEFVISRDKWS
jgi:signal transduction histidine kinase